MQTEHSPKSISAETTFVEDISDPMELKAELAKLTTNIARHLESENVRGRTVTVKLRLSDYTTMTRQTTLSSYTNSEEIILETGWRLLTGELAPGRAFRLLGIGLSGFNQAPDGSNQLTLPFQ